MAEIARDRSRKELEDLKQIYEMPRLYLANFFSDLRNQVDFQIVSKQSNIENIHELNRVWLEIIKKINSFENKCANKKIGDEPALKKRLETLDNELNNEFKTNISVGIQNEQELLLKKLFKNKTIAFIDCKGFLDGSNRNIIDHKLVIIDDEFISPKALKQRLV